MLGFEFYLCLIILLVLLVDIIKRYRKRAVGIDSIYVFKGFVNFPTLSLLGFICSAFVGWAGWLFGIIAAISLTEEIKVVKIDKIGNAQETDFFNNVMLRLLVSIFLLAEFLLIGCLLRFLIISIDPII